MEEVTGSLANGNQFRLTATSIEILGPGGTPLQHLERTDISMYARFGNNLRIVTPHGFSVELPATSDTDARQIEEHVRRVRSGAAATPGTKRFEHAPRNAAPVAAGSALQITGSDWTSMARPAAVLTATYIATLVAGLALIYLVLSTIYG